jgi:hypothetical protein
MRQAQAAEAQIAAVTVALAETALQTERRPIPLEAGIAVTAEKSRPANGASSNTSRPPSCVIATRR